MFFHDVDASLVWAFAHPLGKGCFIEIVKTPDEIMCPQSTWLKQLAEKLLYWAV
jgi:hypothetical protein